MIVNSAKTIVGCVVVGGSFVCTTVDVISNLVVGVVSGRRVISVLADVTGWVVADI